MSVKLRMTRIGRRHRPFFRINAIESREPRDGRVLEKLGHYDPIEKDQAKQIVLNLERVKYWLDKGAIPSDTVSQILLRLGIETKYAKEKTARLAKAKAIARAKGKFFMKAEKIEAEKAVAEAEEKAKLDSIKLKQQIKSGLSLKVNATKKTWFRVVSDKSDTTEYLLKAGRQIDTRADKTFEFLIGRADGLNLVLNGTSLGAIGTDSSVVRYMLIDSSGVVVKLFKEKSESENQEQTNAAI